MKKEFWVTNMSNRNVLLTDLNLTIKSYSSINLLYYKYNYNLEQIEKSVSNGSIYKKRDKIILREKAPEAVNNRILFSENSFLPDRKRSVVIIKHENYEELNISDEEFAIENAKLEIDE